MKPISLKMTCLVCLLLLAVIMDFKSYKISNPLIIIGLILGILFNFYEYGWTSISIWFCGILLPILLLFPLFLMKALGAGDIKLFSVIGCFYGLTYVLKSIVAAFFIAAVMSIIYLIKYRQVFYRLHHLVNYIQTISSKHLSVWQNTETGVKKEIEPYYDRKRDGYQGVIHFSAAILAAILLQLIFHIY